MDTLIIIGVIAFVVGVIILAKKINSKVPNQATSTGYANGYPYTAGCGNCEVVNFHADKGFSFTAKWKSADGKDQSAYIQKGGSLNGIQTLKGTASGGPFTIQ